MKKKLVKVISYLLCVSICFTHVNTIAFAEDGIKEATSDKYLVNEKTNVKETKTPKNSDKEKKITINYLLTPATIGTDIKSIEYNRSCWYWSKASYGDNYLYRTTNMPSFDSHAYENMGFYNTNSGIWSDDVSATKKVDFIDDEYIYVKDFENKLLTLKWYENRLNSDLRSMYVVFKDEETAIKASENFKFSVKVGNATIDNSSVSDVIPAKYVIENNSGYAIRILFDASNNKDVKMPFVNFEDMQFSVVSKNTGNESKLDVKVVPEENNRYEGRYIAVDNGDISSLLNENKEEPILKNGEAFIKSTATDDEIKEILFDALIENPRNVNKGINEIEWEFYYNAGSRWVDVLKGAKWGSGWFGSRTAKPLKEQLSGNYKVRIKGSKDEVKLVKLGKKDAKIVLNSDISLKYEDNSEQLKEIILDKFINWEESNLPNRSELTHEDFDMQYYGASKMGVPIAGKITNGWADISGGNGTGINFALSYPKMGAGENQSVSIKFKGNDTYKSSIYTEGKLSIDKGYMPIYVSSTNIFTGNKLPNNFIKLKEKRDDVDIWTVYTGMENNLTPSVYVDLPEKFTKYISYLDPFVKPILGKTISTLFNEGIRYNEFRKLFSSDILSKACKVIGLDFEVVDDVLSIIDKATAYVDFKICLGAPTRAPGLYTVTALSSSQNFNTSMDAGMLLVRMKAWGNKLTWNNEIKEKLTVEKAKNFDFKATLSHNGDVKVKQNIRYLYSGITNKWRIYSSTTEPPKDPGSYVMTVVTLGGDYIAAPITRSFKIIK